MHREDVFGACRLFGASVHLKLMPYWSNFQQRRCPYSFYAGTKLRMTGNFLCCFQTPNLPTSPLLPPPPGLLPPPQDGRTAYTVIRAREYEAESLTVVMILTRLTECLVCCLFYRNKWIQTNMKLNLRLKIRNQNAILTDMGGEGGGRVRQPLHAHGRQTMFTNGEPDGGIIDFITRTLGVKQDVFLSGEKAWF